MVVLRESVLLSSAVRAASPYPERRDFVVIVNAAVPALITKMRPGFFLKGRCPLDLFFAHVGEIRLKLRVIVAGFRRHGVELFAHSRKGAEGNVQIGNIAVEDIDQNLLDLAHVLALAIEKFWCR
jgi:hypothetical protein